MRALEPLTRDYAAPVGNERQLSNSWGTSWATLSLASRGTLLI
jgi:hypothetical protein